MKRKFLALSLLIMLLTIITITTIPKTYAIQGDPYVPAFDNPKDYIGNPMDSVNFSQGYVYQYGYAEDVWQFSFTTTNLRDQFNQPVDAIYLDLPLGILENNYVSITIQWLDNTLTTLDLISTTGATDPLYLDLRYIVDDIPSGTQYAKIFVSTKYDEADITANPLITSGIMSYVEDNWVMKNQTFIDFLDYTAVYYDGYDAGETIGYNDGYNAGYNVGYEEAEALNSDLTQADLDDAYTDGYTAGLSETAADAYQQGLLDGATGNFMADLDKWIVPAIIIVLIGGGFIAFAKYRKRD